MRPKSMASAFERANVSAGASSRSLAASGSATTPSRVSPGVFAVWLHSPGTDEIDDLSITIGQRLKGGETAIHHAVTGQPGIALVRGDGAGGWKRAGHFLVGTVGTAAEHRLRRGRHLTCSCRNMQHG